MVIVSFAPSPVSVAVSPVDGRHGGARGAGQGEGGGRGRGHEGGGAAGADGAVCVFHAALDAAGSWLFRASF